MSGPAEHVLVPWQPEGPVQTTVVPTTHGEEASPSPPASGGEAASSPGVAASGGSRSIPGKGGSSSVLPQVATATARTTDTTIVANEVPRATGAFYASAPACGVRAVTDLLAHRRRRRERCTHRPIAEPDLQCAL